jgi:transposase
MDSRTIFSLALGITSPWTLQGVRFEQTADSQRQLHIDIGFEAGSRFKDEQGKLCPVHDTVERSWKHLSFFQHECFLHCNVPRIKTSIAGVSTVQVPWARPGSGFTLLFEAFALALIEREMPVNRAAQMLGEYPQRIWTIFNHWVSKALEQDQLEPVEHLGIDETSTKKGHHYVTLGVDLQRGRVIHVAQGKDSKAVASIAKKIKDKGGDCQQVSQVSMDLSAAFMAGVSASFANAKITFDKFHIVKLLNDAMDTVRRQERREHQELKGHRYMFLRNPATLSQSATAKLQDLVQLYPVLGKAYRLKTLFADLWTMPDRATAQAFVEDWLAQAQECVIGPFIKFARTVKAHLSGILQYFDSGLTNAMLEGINNKVQLAKRRARGYRNPTNFANMIYFLCGRLTMPYPRYFI